MRQRSRQHWCCLVGIIAACSPRAPLAREGYSFIDSVGVIVVDNENDVESLGTVVDESQRQILLPPMDLHRVRDARIQENGTVVLANTGLNHVLFINPRTGRHAVSGRRGQGPGEFDGMSGLALCHGDTVVVFDENRGVVHLLDREGAFVTRYFATVNGQGRPWEISGVGGDCKSIAILQQAVGEENRERSGSIGALPLLVSWLDLQARTLISVATVPGLESFLLPDLGGFVTMPFGNKPSFAVENDRIHVGTGTIPEIRTYDRRGQLGRILRWRAERQLISKGDRNRYHETREVAIRLYGSDFERGFRPLNEYTVRVKPIYSRILMEGNGRIWVQKYPHNWVGWEERFNLGIGPEPEAWWIFSASGRLLGLGTTPTGLVVHDIRNGMVAGVTRDMNDVEQVVLYPLAARIREPESRSRR